MSKTFNKSQLKKMSKKTSRKTVSGGRESTHFVVSTKAAKKRTAYGSTFMTTSTKAAKKRTAYGSAIVD